jgi:hypothetical protein
LGGGGGGRRREDYRRLGENGGNEETQYSSHSHHHQRFYTPPISAGQIFVSTVCEEVIRDVKGEEDEGKSEGGRTHRKE